MRCSYAQSMIQLISGFRMKNTLFKIALVLFSVVLGACAEAEEYFWLTHIATPFTNAEASYPNVDAPSYAPTVLTILDGRILMNRNGCNVDIDKVSPFTKSRAFVDIVNDAGGGEKFDRFLAVELHTKISDWTHRYFVRVPGDNPGGPGCEVLNGMIFRSKNDLIITNSTYFLRFSKGSKSHAPKDYPKTPSGFDG